MNTRERTLLIILVSIVGGFVLIVGTMQYFVKPLQELNASITKLTEEVEEKDREVETFHRDKKNLDMARRRSLPANAERAAAFYIYYLQSVLSESGLKVEDVTPVPATKMKFTPTVPNIKEVGHQIISFQVRAKGELKQLAAAMDALQKTPYEHRIKSLTIDRENIGVAKDVSNRLAINMTVETLLVSKTENKPGLPPGVDPRQIILDGVAGRSLGTPLGWGLLASTLMLKQSVPAAPDYRHYDEMYKKNIFVGAIPAKPKAVKPTADPGPEPPEDFVPLFVKLSFIDALQEKAYLRNTIYDVHYPPFAARSGYDEFNLTDDSKKYSYFRAKILRVDPRALFYQVKDKIFAIKVGESFADAMYIPHTLPKDDTTAAKALLRLYKDISTGTLTPVQTKSLKLYNNLTDAEVEALGLEDLYDNDWAKGSTSSKTSFKKQRGGKGG